MESTAKAMATTQHDVPDMLLRGILARLMASPIALVRAAATCKRWRRIMTWSGFFANAVHYGPRPHPRPLAGSYYNNRASPSSGQGIIFVPASPPAEEHAISSHNFSLYFLPGGSRPWEVVDSSRSLLLLARKKTSGWMRRCFPELLVCEPATRRYRLIPPMEEMKHHRCLFAYLDRTERHAEFNPVNRSDFHVVDIMTAFKVVCVVYEGFDGVSGDVGCARACIFARDTKNRTRRWLPPELPDSWYVGPHTWYAEKSHRIWNKVFLHSPDSLHFLGKAGGSLFWSIKGDERRLLTSTDVRSLPDHFRGTVLRVIDDSARENIQCVCLQRSCLQIFVFEENNWALRKSLELMEAARGLAEYKEEYFGGSLKLVMSSPRSIVLSPADQMWLFSVDLDTMVVAEHDHKPNDYFGLRDYPCELPWPPTLHACIGRCVRQGQGPCSHTCIC